MTTPLLTDTAFEHLKKIQVKLLPIVPIQASSWKAGKLALVYAEITNTTGAPLRDVVVESMILGTAAAYQPFASWDGNGGLLYDIEPGETWKGYIALLKGVAPGPFNLIVKIGAEVVPFASCWPTYTTYAVEN